MFYDKNVINIRNLVNSADINSNIDLNEIFINEILKYKQNGMKILDIGTGNGFVLIKIREQFKDCELIGIDNSKEMVKEGHKLETNNITILEGSNYKIPFPDNFFDMVTAKNVTQFSAEEVSRVLKPKGKFILREYNEGKGLIEIANLFPRRLIRSRNSNFYIKKLDKADLITISVDNYIIKRKYTNIYDILNTIKSYPMIKDFSEDDEEVIKEFWENKKEYIITSDPFILVSENEKTLKLGGKKMKKVEMLFDCIRSPYDIAHIIQLAIATDCVIYTCGNSIPFDLAKIQSKVRSWNIKGSVNVIHFNTFEEAVAALKSDGKYLIGTSGNVEKSYYDVDMSEINPVIVFGTETSGLTVAKQAMLDDVVKLPMSSDVDFLTLPVVTSAIAYDLYRQFNLNNVYQKGR